MINVNFLLEHESRSFLFLITYYHTFGSRTVFIHLLSKPCLKMFLFPFTLMLVLTGLCQSLYTQTLTCSHEPQHMGLPRIWCKQHSTHCCMGFAFRNGTRSLENEGLQVQYNQQSFTITIQRLVQGEGVYWCGLLDQNDTIIKLAEGYFNDTSPLEYVWSILRWILLPILPLVTIATHLCTSRKVLKPKTEETLYEDIRMTVSQANRQRNDQGANNAVIEQ
ncbi:hypothetical protein AAFF_G00159500 [Aldrovandia affinis]|uniref:Uncharacterized protein n=1 Tax=Aldrovandia affinis TaxID=143900 RepID=A0AAD7RQP8_9TELE|nr:hypothetical protein AAFF_G00159500 [Aldrovandia affinis]